MRKIKKGTILFKNTVGGTPPKRKYKGVVVILESDGYSHRFSIWTTAFKSIPQCDNFIETYSFFKNDWIELS